MGCETCHAGQPGAADPQTAHRGLIARPSDNPQKACGACHGDIVGTFTKSLHFTTRGLENGLRALAGNVRWTAAKPVYAASCKSCHATCGECHVSNPPFRPQPPVILGGLLNGHMFSRTPPMERTCNGCHNGRVGSEYMGQYEGFPADVHFAKAKMACTNCHSGAQLHGQGEAAAANRFAVSTKPTCVGCHPTAAAGKSVRLAHNAHGDKLACAVCHGGISRSCANCHAGSGATSRPVLKIGRNLRPELPFSFALLRHVPTTRDMIDRATGLPNTLANFDRIPTWKTATPHTIQRATARAQSCAACHENPNLFLRLQDLDPHDSQANGRAVTAPPGPTR